VDQERPRRRPRAEDPHADPVGDRRHFASQLAGRRSSTGGFSDTGARSHPSSTDSVLTWRDSHPRMHRSGTKW
jgi:hypothetical protein